MDSLGYGDTRSHGFCGLEGVEMISVSKGNISWRIAGTLISFNIHSTTMTALTARVKAKIANADEAQLKEIMNDWKSISLQYQRNVPAYYSRYADAEIVAAIEAQHDNLARIMEKAERKAEEEAGRIEHVEPEDILVSPTLIPNGTVITTAPSFSTTTMVLAGLGIVGAVLLIRKLKKGRKS
jgi:hypothetical protein